jgi:hypothetical protein
LDNDVRSDELEAMMAHETASNEVFHNQYSLVVSDLNSFKEQNLDKEEINRRHKIMCYVLFVQGFNQGKMWSEEISVSN